MDVFPCSCDILCLWLFKLDGISQHERLLYSFNTSDTNTDVIHDEDEDPGVRDKTLHHVHALKNGTNLL